MILFLIIIPHTKEYCKYNTMSLVGYALHFVMFEIIYS